MTVVREIERLMRNMYGFTVMNAPLQIERKDLPVLDFGG